MTLSDLDSLSAGCVFYSQMSLKQLKGLTWLQCVTSPPSQAFRRTISSHVIIFTTVIIFTGSTFTRVSFPYLLASSHVTKKAELQPHFQPTFKNPELSASFLLHCCLSGDTKGKIHFTQQRVMYEHLFDEHIDCTHTHDKQLLLRKRNQGNKLCPDLENNAKIPLGYFDND